MAQPKPAPADSVRAWPAPASAPAPADSVRAWPAPVPTPAPVAARSVREIAMDAEKDNETSASGHRADAPGSPSGDTPGGPSGDTPGGASGDTLGGASGDTLGGASGDTRGEVSGTPSTDESARPGDIADWDSGPPVGSLGEFAVIERLRELLGEPHDDAILKSIGDDAALLSPPTGGDLIWTCDIQIEGRHFRREWLTPDEVGARAAQISVSDVAAMGGVPLGVLVSLGLPADLRFGALEGVYRGMRRALAPHGTAVIGGNISGAREFSIDLSVLGWVESDLALTRDGARPGDQVYVTGFPGRAAAAVQLLLRGGTSAGEEVRRSADSLSAGGGSGKADSAGAGLAGGVSADAVSASGVSADAVSASAGSSDVVSSGGGSGQTASSPLSREHRATLLAAYRAPRAQIAIGRYLRENDCASAAIDQSDGVSGDLLHIAQESGVGILLHAEALPVPDDLSAAGELLKQNPLSWILGASDDYGLLFTASRDQADRVMAMMSVLAGEQVAVHPIGEVVPGEPVVRLAAPGKEPVVLGAGWDHLHEH